MGVQKKKSSETEVSTPYHAVLENPDQNEKSNHGFIRPNRLEQAQ
jgi:hypothetical protein